MNLICQQPWLLRVHARAVTDLKLPEGDGDILFLGISGPLHAVRGEHLTNHEALAEKCTGIVLYLNDVRFKADEAKDLTSNIKFFVDGIEMQLRRNVLIIGCPTSRDRIADRFILNRNRWPDPESPPEVKAEQLLGTILVGEENANTQEGSK